MGLDRDAIGMSDRPWAEIALRFTLGFEGIGTAIVGTTRHENVVANLHATLEGPLPGRRRGVLP